MIDIHTHLIYGVDDGSRSLEESINIIKKLIDGGVSDVVFTPHYISNTKFSCNNKEKKAIFDRIKKELKKEKIDVNIYLCNELFIDDHILKLLDEEVLTINNSKYLLIELPFDEEVKDLDIIFKQLLDNGLIPIIAHPERYKFIQNDIKAVEKYLHDGILLKGNYESLFDKYGRKSKKALKKLLKANMISFLASDIHREDSMCNAENLRKKL